MNHFGRWSVPWAIPVEVEHVNRFGSLRSSSCDVSNLLKDYGVEPFVVNINQAAKQNNTYRTALSTGTHLQVTLMSLNVGGDIGLEKHSNVDQFLRVEQGQGIVQMGKRKDNLTLKEISMMILQ